MKRKTRKRRILFLLLAVLLILLLSACSQQSMLCDEIQDEIAEEELEDLRITVYFSNPWACYRAPLRVEDLINWVDNQEYGIMMYQLEGQDCLASVQVIQDQLRPDVIEPIELTRRYVDARLYYVLENRKGEKILELLIGGGDPKCMFLNGLPVDYNTVFYDVIRPCVGFQQEDLKWHFASVMDRPTYEHKPSEYPNSVWVCEDPKITLYVREDGIVECQFDEVADNFVSNPMPGGFDTYNNKFYIFNTWIPSEEKPYSDYNFEQFVCRCTFSPKEMTAVVSNDELFDGKYTGKQIVFVKKG